MLQKIIKVGNSYAVTIPKKFIDKYQWKIGQNIHVDENEEQPLLTIADQPIEKKPLDPEFYEWLKSFNKKYKTALAQLAKK